jgi:hypothetical protein
MPHDYFGESVAATYDDHLGTKSDPAELTRTVDVLAELAGDGAALELAIGTGRVAIPLHARGVPVHGVDLSDAMLARLRSKPDAAGIEITVGDMAHVRVPGAFRVVYLVFNTLMNLTDQGEQVACFETAAAHLEPGGAFVVEVMVPELQRLPPGERFRPFDVSDGHLGFDEYDVVTQGLVSHHWTVRDDGVHVGAIPFRYVWPAELDLMARIAGLRLRDRWAGWDRSPFTAESGSHVSVWVKET